MKRVGFGRIAEVYDDTRELPKDASESVINALCEEFGDHGTVLDVGSGTGRFAIPLSRRGLSIVGIDISISMLEASRRKGFSNFVRADSSRMPFRDAAFDFALAVHIFHLLEDWAVTLSEVTRVVKDSLLSVVIKNETKWFGDNYHDMLREKGYDKDHPGIGEKGLAEKVEPDMTKTVASVSRTHPADQVIDRLETRCFSSQWEVPEALHNAVIAEMREKYSGQVFENRYDVLIHRWELRNLSELTRSR